MMAKYPIERSEQVALITVAAVFSVLPTVAVVCRVLARRIANRALDCSDYLMIVAWFFALCFQVIVFLAVLQFGVSIPASEIEAKYGAKALEGFSILLVPIQGLWALSLSACKLSVLLLYKKLFPVSKTLVTAVYVSIALIGAFLLTAVIGGATICHPLQYEWDKTIPGGYCGDLLAIVKTTGGLNLVTDVLALTIALPQLYRLQIPLQSKLILLGTFAVGIVACIVSLFRLVSLVSVNFDDLTGTCAEALIYSAVEPSLAVVLACIPLLRPLLGGNHSKTGTARLAATMKFPGRFSRSMAKQRNMGKSSGGTAEFEMLDDCSAVELQQREMPS